MYCASIDYTNIVRGINLAGYTSQSDVPTFFGRFTDLCPYIFGQSNRLTRWNVGTCLWHVLYVDQLRELYIAERCPYIFWSIQSFNTLKCRDMPSACIVRQSIIRILSGASITRTIHREAMSLHFWSVYRPMSLHFWSIQSVNALKCRDMPSACIVEFARFRRSFHWPAHSSKFILA